MNQNYFIKNMSRFAVKAALLACCVLSDNAGAGFEDRRFEDVRLDLGKKMLRILIEGNVCKSVPDCYAKQLFYASPDAGGVRLSVYWAVDNDVVLRRIYDECVASFFSNPKIEEITLSTVLGSKEEEVKNPFWVRMKIGTTVKFRRNK